MSIKRQAIRFLLGGPIVTTVDFSVYIFLFNFLSFSVSKGISFTCAGIAGYLLNKYWIFKNDRSSCVEIGRYILVNILALGVNVSTNQGIFNVWPGAVYPALAVATAVTSLLTFIGFKWWVFKARELKR